MNRRSNTKVIDRIYYLTVQFFFFNKLLEQQWDSDLVEARYIKDLDENLSIIRLRYGESSKPLFRNREYIVYERRETMDDGTLVIIQLMASNFYHIHLF